MTRLIPSFAFVAVLLLGTSLTYAQEAESEAPVAEAAESEATLPDEPEAESEADAEANSNSSEPVAEVESPEPEEPAEDLAEETEEAGEEDEPVEEEAAEEEPEESADIGGLISRFPALFALMHHAAVHLPIALWLLGAVFVLVGLFVPSWANQIPLACLIGGAITSVAAAASGWWYAHYEWGEEWSWADGLGDFDERLVQHRWTGVSLVIASIVLSVIALISQKKRSKGLGFIWRVGLLVLAAAVGWEGHIGGELIMGEGFLEEAIQTWLTGE